MSLKKSEQNAQVKEWKPSIEQETFISLMTDYNDTRNISEKCKEVGISRTTYYASWLNNDNFVKYYDKERRKARAAIAPHVDGSMSRAAINKGNVQAMRLFYEVSGELDTAGKIQNNIQVNLVSSIRDNPGQLIEVKDVTPEKV